MPKLTEINIAMAEKLFLVKFWMDNFVDMQGKEWGKTPVTVIAADENRQSMVPYEVGIRDYDNSNMLKKISLSCLFGADEAEKLANYISEKENFETSIDEVDLPLDDIWPWFKDMDNAYQGFIGVSKSICSEMGFILAAYYDVRESEMWKKENP